MERVDYLIVGQGIAGSCLALELLGRGRSVMVVDRPQPRSASRVAAGLFNPVTSKVRTSTWMAESLFPFLHRFYDQAQVRVGGRFFFPMTMYRPFPAAEDVKVWSEISNPFVRQVHRQSAFGESVRDGFGGLELTGSGFCDTSEFLTQVRKYLEEQGRWKEGLADPSACAPDEAYRWDGVSADRVIWCEGVAASDHPLFGWLPIRRLKGEVLTVESSLRRDMLFNRGVYLVPDMRSEVRFRVGATYSHTTETGNSEAGLTELRTRLDRLIALHYSEKGADWGFRPTTPDRRPVLGPHPAAGRHWIFNGLGTKGVSLAPWFAAHLASALETGTPMMEDVHIRRFYPLYFKSLQDPR